MRRKIAKLNMVRLLSSLLASVLLMTLLAVLFAPSVFADETAPPEGDFEILPDYDPDADEIDWDSVATSGECGEKLNWSYSSGTLTITGRGNMTDFYEPDMAPWYALRKVIHRVVLPREMTSIGRLAFYDCTKIKTINLPEELRSIGSYAFAECRNLTMVTFGKKLGQIGNAAFYACTKLMDIRLPQSLTTIGKQAFYRCESLTTVTIPQGVTDIGTSVFAYCKNLLCIAISAKLQALPAWTFYGCGHLSVVILPETVNAVNDYAFKKCDSLATVYYDAPDALKNKLQEKIETDVPMFEDGGRISDGIPSAITTSTSYQQREDGALIEESLTVKQNENITIVSKVECAYRDGNFTDGSYRADITVAVENENAWDDVITSLMNELTSIDNNYSAINSKKEQVDVTVYVKTEGTVDDSFVQEMAGRDVKMTVVTQNGSEFRVDCSDLNKEELSGDYNYSYSVDSATQESRDELGTDDCFKLTFEESAKINAEVVIPLPENKGNSNAFLYQVERDGTHTRLQAVAVDNDGNAHFYLGAVDKDTEYVIGVNVPDERTDDVIYPDELLGLDSDTQSAIIRLEKIDYVITGRESSWGLGAMQVTWIMLAVIAVCIVVVGVIMAIWNKRRLERGYVPEIDYEAEEM